MITKEITIEDLIEDYPQSVKYLSEKGIRCIKCGEPIWGTLEEACIEKKFTQDDIAVFVKELNELHNVSQNSNVSITQKVDIKKI